MFHHGIVTPHRYDEASDKWTVVPGSMSTPRYSMGVAAFKNQLFVAGGEMPSHQAANKALASVEVLF